MPHTSSSAIRLQDRVDHWIDRLRTIKRTEHNLATKRLSAHISFLHKLKSNDDHPVDRSLKWDRAKWRVGASVKATTAAVCRLNKNLLHLQKILASAKEALTAIDDATTRRSYRTIVAFGEDFIAQEMDGFSTELKQLADDVEREWKSGEWSQVLAATKPIHIFTAWSECTASNVGLCEEEAQVHRDN